jgi:cyclic nucleotide gated channel, plant
MKLMFPFVLLKFHNILYGHDGGWKKKIGDILSHIPILKPHAKAVQQWNQFFVISCLIAIFIDPLFFFLLSVEQVIFTRFFGIK